MTAAEIHALLDKDTEYCARTKAREAKMVAVVSERKKDELPIIVELRKSGIEVESVYDLVNSKKSYPDAIPVLLRHLRMKHDPSIKEGIVRALIDPASVIGFDIIYDEFCNTPAVSEKQDFIGHQMKWLLGAALAEATRIETLPKVLDLLRDKSQGEGRERLIYVVKILPKKKRQVLLHELSEDPDLEKIIKKAKLNLKE